MSVVEASEISITLPDGSIRQYSAGTTGQQVAASIGSRLAAAAIAAKIDGKVVDLSLPIERDAQVAIITRDSEDALGLIRHDAAHVMAEAVQGLFPGTQVTIGPAIDNGFYYDFARDEPFSLDDLAAVEARMRENCAEERAVHPRSVGPRRRHRILQGQGRNLQGGDHLRPARDRAYQHLPTGRVAGFVSRPTSSPARAG